MKKYQVKTSFKEILEPEEILLDTKERKTKEKGKLEVPIKNNIFLTVFCLFIFLFLILAGRTFQLVFLEGKEMKKAATENYLRTIYYEAPRGLIYSKDGKLLVKNIKISTNKKITKVGAKKERQYYRKYIDNFYFSPIIGYTREANEQELKSDTSYYEFGDWIGKDGIEKEYEKYLRGKKGVRERVVNAKGEILSDKIKRKPEIGDKVILNIDYELQKKIYNTIKKRVPGKDAVAIAVNPQNGAVLSLVSVPSDDNNVFSQEKISAEQIKELEAQKKIYNINKAISAKFPSGSIIKPLIAAAALQEKVISKATTINCKGAVKIPNPWHPEKPTIKKDNRTHGLTNLTKAIAESCNVFFFTVGGGYEEYGIKGLGMTKIKKYLDYFYIEKKLGIDLPGEAVGFVPTKEWFDKEIKKTYKRNWSIADVYDASIGQGFFASPPLHMVMALSSIINGGKIYQPQVVDKIENKKGAKDIKPKVLNRGFIDKENLIAVKEAMRACVTSGSCRRLQSLPVEAGGKTGTAESDKGDLTHAWFVSFAPYENPKIFLLVFVEYGGGGESVASPIASEILNWYFKNRK